MGNPFARARIETEELEHLQNSIQQHKNQINQYKNTQKSKQ